MGHAEVGSRKKYAHIQRLKALLRQALVHVAPTKTSATWIAETKKALRMSFYDEKE
jgi:hypothetical protein